MRKCLRCETEMVEDLEFMVSNGGYGIDVREKGIFKSAIEKIKCAVCPECGYTETYIENTDKVKKLNINVIKNEIKNEEVKQNTNYIENNNVTLVGKVTGEKKFSHEICGEKFYIFNLSTLRLSGNADIIPITISERLITDEMLEEGRNLLVKGQFRSYNICENERNKLVFSVFAKDVEEQENEIIKNDEITNEVVLVGFVCKKPIYRQTPFGREITDLLLAVDREDNKSDYIPTIAWGRNAIFCQNLEVGARVKIIGRVQSRQCEKRYEDGTSEIKVAYEVSICSLELINEEFLFDKS